MHWPPTPWSCNGHVRYLIGWSHKQMGILEKMLGNQKGKSEKIIHNETCSRVEKESSISFLVSIRRKKNETNVLFYHRFAILHNEAYPTLLFCNWWLSLEPFFSRLDNGGVKNNSKNLLQEPMTRVWIMTKQKPCYNLVRLQSNRGSGNPSWWLSNRGLV